MIMPRFSYPCGCCSEVVRMQVKCQFNSRFPPLAFFFFNDTATTEIYTLSLHDALPIYEPVAHPARHVERVGACGRGVRQVEREVGVVAVQRVIRRCKRRNAGPGRAATLTHPLDR